MIRSKRWGTWWTAANGAKWEGRIAARDTAMPEPSQALTVIRVSHTEIKFLTPSNTYLTKAQGVFGYLRTTRNVSNPRSVFTIKYIPRTAYVAFRSSDGYFATQDGKNSPQFKWKRAGEWERYDVREVMEVPAIRGANLGSWLMTEPWMNRDVFKFAGYGDGTRMRCNDSLTTKDTYMHLTTVENASPNTRRISVQWLQYWAVRSNSKYVWVQSTKPEGTASNFELYIFGTPLNESTEQSGGSVCVVLRAPNGLFVQARTDGSLTADLQHSLSNVAIWSSAAAFDLTVVSAWELLAASCFPNGFFLKASLLLCLLAPASLLLPPCSCLLAPSFFPSSHFPSSERTPTASSLLTSNIASGMTASGPALLPSTSLW
ncbi:unnamed protein product [Closterium sp. NIES-54]